MERQNSEKRSYWKLIAGGVAFFAGLAAIIGLVVQLSAQEQQLQAQARQDERMAEQVAKQSAQIALQNTQIALGAEQNRIIGQQGTVTAKQFEVQQARGTSVENAGFSPTATALAATRESADATRQVLDVQRQRIEATQTALAKTPPNAIPPQPQIATLSDCGSFAKGETRTVSRGTFAVGDVYVNDVQQFDNGDGEGTVVFFERSGIIRAPFGAGCYLGSTATLEEIVQQQFRDGCGSRCNTVRVVIVKASGEQNVTYRR